jgi:rubrerythrin
MLVDMAGNKDAYAYWVCPVCGYTAEAEAPEVCPVCGAKGKMFKKVE